jgi:SAM-dependent methyltransferase
MAIRPCPVCGATNPSPEIFVSGSIDPAKLTATSFASRKEPEFMSHRMVRCAGCGLAYVDQPPGQDSLAAEYHRAAYDSAEEADDAARAYIQTLRPTLAKLGRRDAALEIGTGTGVFLEMLRNESFATVVGVEPSSSAIEAAPIHRRAWIREGIFIERDFAPESFDLVCCFMTLEHVLDPSVIAQAAFRLLRPGGALVVVTHDHRGWINRLLGRRSPIIDVEHMQLFSRRSLETLFARAGFEQIGVETFINTYSLRYWLRLLPLPGTLKRIALRLLSGLGVAHWRAGMNVGNLMTAAFKAR